MFHCRVYWSVVFTICVLAMAPMAAGADPKLSTAALRKAVLRADSPDEASAAYKAWFLRLGRARLKALLKDEDTGAALQAAWEIHLKPAKRKREDGRTDDVYHPVELGKFVAFLEKRTK